MGFDTPLIWKLDTEIIAQNSYPVKECETLISRATYETGKALVEVSKDLPMIDTRGSFFFSFDV